MGLALALLSLLPLLTAANPEANKHFKRGLEYSLQQNWKAAEAEYREAVRLEPTNPTYRSHLADVLAAQGKFQQAQESVQQQKKLEKTSAKPTQPPKTTTPTKPTTTATKPPTTKPPSPPTVQPPAPPITKPAPPPVVQPPANPGISIIENTLSDDPIATAIQFYEDGNWTQAEAEYRRVLRLRPGLDEGWNGLGDTYFKQNKWAEAEKAYREAVRLRPEESYYRAQLANALLKLGRMDPAKKEAQEAIRLGLMDHEVFDELGITPR